MEDFQGLVTLPCEPTHITNNLITSVDFQNDGNQLICVADTNAVHLFSLATRIATCKLEQPRPRFLRSLRQGDKSNALAVIYASSVELYSFDGEKLTQTVCYSLNEQEQIQ